MSQEQAFPDRNELDVPRGIGPSLLKALQEPLGDGRNFTVELEHSPGAGGTTAALRAAWDLHSSYPVLVLRRFSRLTADRIDAVYQKTQKAVLLVADASDLPSTSREDLFRELGRRNARIVLLYLIRSSRKNSAGTISILDPMNQPEANHFLRIYQPYCKSEASCALLRRIVESEDTTFEAYRSPFFFGLTAFEKDFLSIDRYVRTHLDGITHLARQAMLYLALTTRYSQKGLTEEFIKRLFRPVMSGQVNLERALGDGPARLVILGRGRIKFIHPLIAEQSLCELLGGGKEDAWRLNLKDLCIQLIRDVVAIAGTNSDETKELFEQLFIYRDQWDDHTDFGRRQFSPLIEAINSIDGQQQVLAYLTEMCSLEPHFWNHRGRHLIYKTNESFAEAEKFLLKAVELSKEQDPLHFHGLGLVRRFWLRHLLSEIFKTAHVTGNRLSPESVLAESGELAGDALDAFARARELSPDDDHGYITAIQTIIMITERLCEAGGYKTVATLCAGNSEVARWAQQRLTEAEELLARVRHFSGHRRVSKHEQKCDLSLTKLYGNAGDLTRLIRTWESVLDRSAAQSWLRKALAHAYLARSNRVWNHLGLDEIRKILDLSECNLSYNPTSEGDLRTWFHACRCLPEFNYSEALDRLQAWANRSNSGDAHYYLYILHFLRWYSGRERNEELLQFHLQRSSQLAVGRRNDAFEWYARTPIWCPVVNAGELGGWDDQKKFWRDSSKLGLVEGTISSLKRTAGTIRIGNTTRAFFVPPSHLRESEHINAKVHFFLGFSYERLNAWSVNLGQAPKNVTDI